MNHCTTGIPDFRQILLGGLVGVGAGLLSGCNWSPPTLAVEMVRSETVEPIIAPQHVEIATPEPAEPSDAATESAIPQSAEVATMTVDSSSSDASGPKLLPKLPGATVEQLLGRWQDSFFGTRTLTLNADGSAKMVLDLDFAGRLLYGKRLEFDMKWSLDSGVVKIDILEGRPAAASKSATGTWGNRYEYLIDRVEADAVEMRSSDGSLNHTLKRLPDNE